ncbi:unnamed protein product [Oikopleura dioica]|uniref:E1 domain-containing protein n=1 Tax=Oikopleura dioica TaxID=34765 RepID=E4XRI7_OIKDI|nr:unnamed protein product [Oikopleura dioica]
MWRFLCLVVSALAELSIKNSAPAIASRCKRLAQKRENGVWTSSKVSSTCSTFDDEEAVRICKEAFPSLFIIGVRPTGAEHVEGPWCQATHEDWSRPCKGKGHMVMVYECLHRDNNPNVRKEIKHIDEFVIPRVSFNPIFQIFIF